MKRSKFLKDDLPEGIEKVSIQLGDVRWSEGQVEAVGLPVFTRSTGTHGYVESESPGDVIGIRLDRLLFLSGLADSVTDAARKIKANSVKVLDQEEDREFLASSSRITLSWHSAYRGLVIKVGKRIKQVEIQQ